MGKQPRRLQYKSAVGGATQAKEYKTATSGGSTVLNTDPKNGIVEALVSITGVVDRQNDVIVPGAYARTLKALRPNGHRFHDMTRRVAKTLVAEEWMPGDRRLPETLADGETPWPKDAGALYIKGQYNLGTQDGRDAFADAEFFGPEGQWSIGYNPHGKDGAHKRKDGVRELRDLDLWEWSDVSHGAAPITTTLGVKDAGPTDGDGGTLDSPGGFLSDPVDVNKAGFVASQPRAATGTWSGGGGSGSSGHAGPDSANGLSEGWLGQVLKGDSRYVESRGGGGGGASAGSASRNQEMDMRDAVDTAFDTERMAEKKRRLEADRSVEAADDPETGKALEADEKERRRGWQESFDGVVAKERQRRRDWNAQHRNRTAGKARLSDDAILFDTEEPLGSDGPEGVEVKMMNVLAGSYEELRERVRLAADAWFRAQYDHEAHGNPDDPDYDPDGPVPDLSWSEVIGTWPGRAVVCFYADNGLREHYEFTVVTNGGEVTLVNPSPVEIVSTVTRTDSSHAGRYVGLKGLLNEVSLAVSLAEAAGVDGDGVATQFKRLAWAIEDISEEIDDLTGEDDDDLDDDEDDNDDAQGKSGMNIDDYNKLMEQAGRPLIGATR